MYDTAITDQGSTIIAEWQQRSTYFTGKRVRVTLANESIVGITDGLESDGALRVRNGNGEVSIVHAGDVESLRTNELKAVEELN